MHRQDSAGLARDLLLDLLGIERVGRRVHVHEDRIRAHVADGPGGRHEGHGDGDDLIARPDSRRDQRQMQGRRAGVDANAVFAARVGGKGLLELGHFGAKHVAHAVGDFLKRLDNLFAQQAILRAQVYHRQRRGGSG